MAQRSTSFKLRFLAMPFAFACGAEAVDDFDHQKAAEYLANNPVDLPQPPQDPPPQVLPYGEVPITEKVDKWISVIHNNDKVWIPTDYGAYTGDGRCANTLASWVEDCDVQQDRSIKFCFNSAICNQVDPAGQITNAIADSIAAWMDVATNTAGWDVSFVSCGAGQNLTIQCGDVPGTRGVTYQTTSFCWNLPVYQAHRRTG